jgi:hypothetical protein
VRKLHGRRYAITSKLDIQHDTHLHGVYRVVRPSRTKRTKGIKQMVHIYLDDSLTEEELRDTVAEVRETDKEDSNLEKWTFYWNGGDVDISGIGG